MFVRIVSFVKVHEKKFLILITSSFVVLGPHFGGSVVAELIDKTLVGSTVVANARILEFI